MKVNGPRPRPGRLFVTVGDSPSVPFQLGAAPPTPVPPAAVSPPPAPVLPASPSPPDAPVSAREARFARILGAADVDLVALREAAWSGVPPSLRPLVWRLLCGVAPPSTERRAAALARKRAEYGRLVERHYGRGDASALSEQEAATLRQIQIDTPRTAPEVGWARCRAVAGALERVLFVRAVRSSAAGYVQGLADVLLPFLAVFLAESVCAGLPLADEEGWTARLEGCGAGSAALGEAEADCYWCAAHLLDGIQDNYTFAQLGIQRAVHTLGQLTRRLDAPLAAHFEQQGVDPLQFAFRWVNCLLVRELPLRLLPRLWDTLLAESAEVGGASAAQRLPAFLPFLLAALLLRWRAELLRLDFQGALMLLQRLPTGGWGEAQVSELLSEAHQHRARFAGAESHLTMGS